MPFRWQKAKQSPWWRLPLKSLGLLGITVSAVFIGILLPGWAQLAHSWLTTHLDFPQWAFGVLFDLMLWLYLSSCVGVFGVCFCVAQAEVREHASGHPEWPGD